MLSNRKQVFEDVLEQLEKSFKETPLILEKKYQYDLDFEDLWETLKSFMTSEIDRLEQSKFHPAYFELAFGGRDADYPALTLESEGRLIEIRGKIDRIDLNAEKTIGRVMDYKRTASFSPSDLDLGIALQLPLYSMVLEKLVGVQSAGAELYSIKGKKLNGFYHKDYLELFQKMSSRKMILPKKEYDELMNRMEQFILRFSKGMHDMNIEVRPRKCEAYCPYSAICRIEKWKTPLMAEKIKREDKEWLAQVPALSNPS